MHRAHAKPHQMLHMLARSLVLPSFSCARRQVQVNQLKQERWALADELAACEQTAGQAARAALWEAAEAEEAIMGVARQPAEAEEAVGAVLQAHPRDHAEAASLQGLFSDAMHDQQDRSARVRVHDAHSNMTHGRTQATTVPSFVEMPAAGTGML